MPPTGGSKGQHDHRGRCAEPLLAAPARTPASSGSASGPLEGGQEPQDLLGLFSAFGHDAVTKSAISAQFNFVPARGTLFHEGTPAMAIHIVRTGTFKCCRVDTWGGERVLDFARRGDVLGYAALGRGHYTSSAVALEPATVVVVPIEDLFSWLQRLPALQRSLHHALSLQHARAEELSDVRAVLPAEVRLARFLLHWSARVAFSGQSMRQLKLAMSRRDIARLLGVAHETVSRAFGSLATAAAWWRQAAPSTFAILPPCSPSRANPWLHAR